MERDLRPAFYALRTGGWRDYLTLLHPPYTAWHLSYVVLGAASAPTLRLDRLGGVVLAFFLAVGLAAHSLDELNGRPLKTRVPSGGLVAIAALSLLGALAIGVIAIATISLWAIPFVVAGPFLVLAYNLEWFKGRFHSDAWFAFGWGAFPALVGYWASAERLDVGAIIVAAACFVLSLVQRVLSTQVRRLRRRSLAASGKVEFQDGEVDAITVPYLLTVPERALRLLGVFVVLIALGLLVARR